MPLNWFFFHAASSLSLSLLDSLLPCSQRRWSFRPSQLSWNVCDGHLWPITFVHQTQATIGRQPIWISISPVNRWSTGPLLTLLVSFARQPRRKKPDLTRFLLRLSIEFDTKVLWRHWPCMYSPRLASYTCFLGKRVISLWIDGVLSRSFPVNTGVPQGSALSPSSSLNSQMICILPPTQLILLL